MGVAAVAVAIGSMMFSAYSAHNQAKQQKAQYEYQAAVDANNAKIAEWNAEAVARQGEDELTRHRRQVAAKQGTQRATFASRGIDLGSGSALNLLTDSEFFGEEDAKNIQDSTAQQVWGVKVQKDNYQASSKANKARAGSVSPWLNAAGSALGSAGQVSSSWKTYKGS